MDYYENVVFHYLRSDRAIFVNTECCIQLNQNQNPDKSGPHWYCDAVALDLRNNTVFLCEISYSKGLVSLVKRLREWHDAWEKVCDALIRDSFLNKDWPVRPWLFVPEEYVPRLLKRLDEIRADKPLKFSPRITTLQMTEPWRFQSWGRNGETTKPDYIPQEMRD